MTLLSWLVIAAVVVALIYLWRPVVGYIVAALSFIVASGVYMWAELSWQAYAWSWALPFAASLIVVIPGIRCSYIFLSRKMNGWSQFTLEIEDSYGHLHYVKGIDRGNYINGGSGSGKTASCNRAYACHAATYRMPLLVHDLKKYELSTMLYPIFRDAGIDYSVFALFDPERSVRVNPIAPQYIPDEASLKARVKSFIIAAQGHESSDSTADFFNNASASLLEALIWYLKCYKPECCNLPFVLSILNDPINLHRQAGKVTIPYGKLDRLLRRDPQIYSMASSFFQGVGNANTTGNILQTLLLALQTINTDAGFYLLSENEFDLHINAKGSKVAFAMVNDPANTLANAPVLAMVGDAAMTMMCAKGSDPACVLLDEAAEYPSARMQNYIAYFRSLGVCMVYTTQDMSQIQRTQSGKEYNVLTMMSNFAHQFFGRTSIEKTAKYYEGLMPMVDKTEHTYSTSTNGGSSSRRTVKKRLYESTEFFSLKQGEFVYFNGRVKRFRFKYVKGEMQLPPKLRTMNTEQMHRLATEIRQAAKEFMGTFAEPDF